MRLWLYCAVSALAFAQISAHDIRIYPAAADDGTICFEERISNGTDKICLTAPSASGGTRTVLFQDVSHTLAGTDIPNNFTADQLPFSDRGNNLGSQSKRWANYYGDVLAYEATTGSTRCFVSSAAVGCVNAIGVVTTSMTQSTGAMISGHHTPLTDATYDVGSSSLKWRDAFLNHLTMSGDIGFATGSTHNIGNSGSRPLRIFTDGLTSYSSVFFNGTISTDFIPTSAAAVDLGSASAPWRSGYFGTSLLLHNGSGSANWTMSWQENSTARQIGFTDDSGNTRFVIESSASLTGDRVLVNGNVIPVNSTNDLGSTTNRWDDLNAVAINLSSGTLVMNGTTRIDGSGNVASANGVTTTLTCPATQAVTAITVVAGIVTSVNCSVP